MKKVMDMTLQEILDKGGIVNIYFHELEDKKEAASVLGDFSELGQVVERSRNSHEWLKVEDNDIKVCAFYENTDEPETVNNNLTEYERKMKESGHKESDFR